METTNKYEYSTQVGNFCAQVFKDGKSLLVIETTENPDEASEMAKRISDILNMNETINILKVPEYIKSVEHVMQNGAIQYEISTASNKSLLADRYKNFITCLKALKRIED